MCASLRDREKQKIISRFVHLKTTQITAACGCTSKWLLYRSVTSTTQGIETELASGSLLAADPGHRR